MVNSSSVLTGVKVHGPEETGPEELLAGVGVVMITGVVEVVDVFEEPRDFAGSEEDGNEDVLLAVCGEEGREGWREGGLQLSTS